MGGGLTENRSNPNFLGPSRTWDSGWEAGGGTNTQADPMQVRTTLVSDRRHMRRAEAGRLVEVKSGFGGAILK